MAAPGVDAPPRVGRGAGRDGARSSCPCPRRRACDAVAFGEGGAWEELGGALPILATPAGPVAAVAEQDAGRAVLLADAAPLHNDALARADNAAFGLAAAGGADRPVVFLETVHGYGEATGLAALPGRALWVLAGLALAALALVWSMARRLGPAEDEARALAPPRRDYVEALAAALAATGDREGVAGAAARGARLRLEARAGLPPGADDAALREAAARFGLDAAETAALLGAGDAATAWRPAARWRSSRRARERSCRHAGAAPARRRRGRARSSSGRTSRWR